MPLRTLFIDAGGTLIQENPSRAEIYARVARAQGRAIDAAAMGVLMGAAHDALPLELGDAFRYSDPWFEAFIERIFRAQLGLRPEALPGIARELFERFSDPRTFVPFPGAREVLERLADRGLRVAVVSNWSGRLAGLLADLGLAGSLTAVVASAEVRCEKPSARIFERALALTESRPSEALHAGDHPLNDVEGARRAGIGAVLVDHHGRHAGSTLPRVGSLLELEHLVWERAA